jgi:dihydrodipicolinate reductase
MKSGCPAVMQVVAFQAMMELMAKNFPGVFSGYKLEVVESHQRNKADTSGTAKAVVASFQQMGIQAFKEVRIAGQIVCYVPHRRTAYVLLASNGEVLAERTMSSR